MPASCPAALPTSGLPDPRRLLALLAEDDVDAAIDAGLASLGDEALARMAPDEAATLRDARDRLLIAWAARARHQARDDRHARLAADREAKRQARTAAAAPSAGRPALPPAAAAALARATARAKGR